MLNQFEQLQRVYLFINFFIFMDLFIYLFMDLFIYLLSLQDVTFIPAGVTCSAICIFDGAVSLQGGYSLCASVYLRSFLICFVCSAVPGYIKAD